MSYALQFLCKYHDLWLTCSVRYVKNEFKDMFMCRKFIHKCLFELSYF